MRWNIIDCDNKQNPVNSPRSNQDRANQKYQKCRSIVKLKAEIIDHDCFRLEFQVRRDLCESCQHFFVVFFCFLICSLSCLWFCETSWLTDFRGQNHFFSSLKSYSVTTRDEVFLFLTLFNFFSHAQTNWWTHRFDKSRQFNQPLKSALFFEKWTGKLHLWLLKTTNANETQFPTFLFLLWF